MAEITTEIFRAYDIRGVYPEELNEPLAFEIGRALTHFIGNPIAVGHDVRISSEPLAEALIEGIISSGRDVVDLGCVTTPLLYFSVADQGYAGGVTVTASHNPPKDNGFKLCRRDAIPFAEGDIQALKEKVKQTVASPLPCRGRLYGVNPLPAYAQFISDHGQPLARLRIVVDAGNGAGGVIAPEIYGRLNIEVIPLFCEPDGRFPNHEPDPLRPQNLTALCHMVRESQANFGIGLDGDADRIIFVDERGEIVPSDILVALLGADFAQRCPGTAIVFDVRSSRVVKEEVEKHGGRALRNRVGHTYFKQRMRQEEAVFGGELSGHLYFSASFYAECPELAVVELSHLLCKRESTLSELIRPLRRYVQSGELNYKLADFDSVIARVRHAFRKYQVSEIDGLLVEGSEWWFNLRPSNTEPYLRLNLEAPTESELVQLRTELERFLR